MRAKSETTHLKKIQGVSSWRWTWVRMGNKTSRKWWELMMHDRLQFTESIPGNLWCWRKEVQKNIFKLSEQCKRAYEIPCVAMAVLGKYDNQRRITRQPQKVTNIFVLCNKLALLPALSFFITLRKLVYLSREIRKVFMSICPILFFLFALALVFQ